MGRERGEERGEGSEVLRERRSRAGKNFREGRILFCFLQNRAFSFSFSLFLSLSLLCFLPLTDSPHRALGLLRGGVDCCVGVCFLGKRKEEGKFKISVFDLRSSLKNARFRSTLSLSVFVERALGKEITHEPNGDAIETRGRERMARAVNDASIFLFFFLTRAFRLLPSRLSFILPSFLPLFLPPPKTHLHRRPSPASRPSRASRRRACWCAPSFLRFPSCRKKGKIERKEKRRK